MTESREYCKRVAAEIESYVNGEFYYCPECGEVITFDDESTCTCQECNASFDESDLEVLSIYDYLDDVLDFEYTIDSSKRYKSVKVYVTLGGPNVWIDTSNNTVQLRWGSDREEWCISSKAGEQIDSYFEELFNC